MEAAAGMSSSRVPPGLAALADSGQALTGCQWLTPRAPLGPGAPAAAGHANLQVDRCGPVPIATTRHRTKKQRRPFARWFPKGGQGVCLETSVLDQGPRAQRRQKMSRRVR